MPTGGSVIKLWLTENNIMDLLDGIKAAKAADSTDAAFIAYNNIIDLCQSLYDAFPDDDSAIMSPSLTKAVEEFLYAIGLIAIKDALPRDLRTYLRDAEESAADTGEEIEDISALAEELFFSDQAEHINPNVLVPLTTKTRKLLKEAGLGYFLS